MSFDASACKTETLGVSLSLILLYGKPVLRAKGCDMLYIHPVLVYPYW